MANAHYLVIAGSLRQDSFNKKLAREAVRVLGEQARATAEFADLRDYPMPVYDGDIQNTQGFPDAVKALAEKIEKAAGLVIASPEYNGGISGVLKNALDWLSRLKPMPLAEKHTLLLSASPGALGGVRGLWHTRVPLEAMAMHVFPTMMGLPGADKAFDDAGRLVAEKPAAQLRDLIQKFSAFVTR